MFADIKVETEDILFLTNIINQRTQTKIINVIFKAHKIPRNDANPFPPFKFSIHTGKIWPSKITDADKIIKSPLIIMQIDIAI